MAHNTELITLSQAMEKELRQDILPFWIDHTVDPVRGGFHGALTNDLQVHDDVERSLVLTARVLWTYSAVYRKYGVPAYLEMARHAYAYLIEKFLDPQYGGMYWWIDCDGHPINDRKQTYGQAFAIYALSEYYQATRQPEALGLALDLFELVEKHAFEPEYGGYIEGCARDWGRLKDLRLSDKEPNAPKTMNTLLHVLEGYTNLLRAWPDVRVRTALMKLLQVFLSHVVDPQTHFTRLFFENDWTSTSDLISFGHDIETSWLLVEAAEVLDEEKFIQNASQVAVEMAEAVRTHGLDADGAVVHEGSPSGIHDDTRHWWCEAEGIVGFVNAYQISGDEKYAQAALKIWDFITAHMLDRQNGEWCKILDRQGNPIPGQWKAGPWEDPYHHSRACLEIIRRAKSLS